jgi:hypothetical protein
MLAKSDAEAASAPKTHHRSSPVETHAHEVPGVLKAPNVLKVQTATEVGPLPVQEEEVTTATASPPEVKRGRGRPKRMRTQEELACAEDSQPKRRFGRSINGPQHIVSSRDGKYLRGIWCPTTEADMLVPNPETLWSLISDSCDFPFTKADMEYLGTLIEDTEVSFSAALDRPMRKGGPMIGEGIDAAYHNAILSEVEAECVEKVEGKRLPVFKNYPFDVLIELKNAALQQLQEYAQRELGRLSQLATAEMLFESSGVRQASLSYDRTLEAAYTAICMRRTLMGYGVRNNDVNHRRRRGAAGSASTSTFSSSFAASQDELISNGLLLMHSASEGAHFVQSVPQSKPNPDQEPAVDLASRVAHADQVLVEVPVSTAVEVSDVTSDSQLTAQLIPTTAQCTMSPVSAEVIELPVSLPLTASNATIVDTSCDHVSLAATVVENNTPVSGSGRPGTRMASGVQLQTKFNIRIYGPDTVIVAPAAEATPTKASPSLSPAESTAASRARAAANSSRTKRRRFNQMMQHGPFSLLTSRFVELGTDYLHFGSNVGSSTNSSSSSSASSSLCTSGHSDSGQETNASESAGSVSSGASSLVHSAFVASLVAGSSADLWMDDIWVRMRVLNVFRDDSTITRFVKLRPCSGYSPLSNPHGTRNCHDSVWICVDEYYIDTHGVKQWLLMPCGQFYSNEMLMHKNVPITVTI